MRIDILFKIKYRRFDACFCGLGSLCFLFSSFFHFQAFKEMNVTLYKVCIISISFIYQKAYKMKEIEEKEMERI